jgi:phenylpyruvate tautomerase PptA (4-oxalocrotonate tautomerase family)
MVEMFVSAGVLDAETKAKLHRNVGRQVLEAEGGTGTHLERAITWVFIFEVDGDTWSVGGEPVTADHQARFLTRITVPAGSMDDERRECVAARVQHEIVAALGYDPGAINCICLITEVPTGTWRGGGLIVGFVDIMRMLGLEERIFRYPASTIREAANSSSVPANAHRPTVF